MKKIGKFLSSMGFAVSLLVLLAAACALSSLVEQGLTQEAYAAMYGDTWASVIMALQVNDAYHSVWFIALSAFLCLNLILCNVSRFPAFLRRYRAEKDAAAALRTVGDLGEIPAEDPEKVFAGLGMRTLKKCAAEDGREALFAQKNRLGTWGAWVCHLGILILIAGFVLGQITLREAVLWGVPGDAFRMQDTGEEVTIDDFRTEKREDGSTAQYVTELTVTDPVSGKTEKKTVSVNNPVSIGGFQFTQNNTGMAAVVSVFRNGKEIQRKTLIPGGTMEESVLGLAGAPEYAIYFADMRTMPGGAGEEQTVTFFDVFYQGAWQEEYPFLGDGTAEIAGYKVTFRLCAFTLLAGRQDRFMPLALFGGILTMLGLLLAFYLQPKALWAIREESGQWIIRGRCRKGTVLWREQVEEAAGYSAREKQEGEEAKDAER